MYFRYDSIDAEDFPVTRYLSISSRCYFLSLGLFIGIVICVMSYPTTPLQNIVIGSSVVSYAYLIRHGEKVTDRQFGLSVQGSIHAACYVHYFKNIPTGPPHIIFSSLSGSKRALITGIPLAIELNIPIYAKRNLASSIIMPTISAGTTALIIMEHTQIPILATKLGCPVCNSWSSNPPSHVSSKENLYDWVWILEFHSAVFTKFTTAIYAINRSTCMNASYNVIEWDSNSS